ncbi:helix-turn-helix domain-containing protein [Streptomyces sp. Edi2]|uniref:helix-turn-helix domain-containing protein n=1 Tax=Streptomyces sp. Edi2 TaxID=3162528 RepID=UPI003305B650
MLVSGRTVAESLQALASSLVRAEHTDADLRELLRLAGQIGSELDCYRAAAVHAAVRKGNGGWEEVAEAAGAAVSTVRARWSRTAVHRLLARRDRARQPTSPERAGGERYRKTPLERPARAWEPLAAALSQLHKTSGSTVAAAASMLGVDPSYVHRMLTGERTPPWPVTEALTISLAGRPDDVRALWERAHGVQRPSRQPLHVAAKELHSAFRGLHLALGQPAAEAISEMTHRQLSPGAVQAVLDGEAVPDWAATGALTVALRGEPHHIRPLWEAVHYAVLAGSTSGPPLLTRRTTTQGPTLTTPHPPAGGSTGPSSTRGT